ncbi:hypothetical protein NPIL_117751 [Nephila pilipes]|uniref:Uncharacterized protein n=1 Tax=Nephila pilipes TaxID=299642 RepID=A0A8X6PBN0_NEPPI|nr:hypothetical protein NPIL_117751 [Nephila pilipes]
MNSCRPFPVRPILSHLLLVDWWKGQGRLKWVTMECEGFLWADIRWPEIGKRNPLGLKKKKYLMVMEKKKQPRPEVSGRADEVIGCQQRWTDIDKIPGSDARAVHTPPLKNKGRNR